ncbi:sugar ABC transporter permease [Nocardioides szechwanensis]|uniref:Cellobiose ABC transporter membrane protein n=1 Tax=Nocardioides szechwanensis TaxID=1005944 RepID=A0A1H0BKG9_9ACTN|nr:sugar ABC transporter permease [Nocardioides szechwanensis]GEP36123.1 sugar ABC transporter permease [Nocardioides szechwanensis]SDN45913.1 cellobiose ABC transporter membrane protein [Nocardioides szechwanensis]
MSSHPPTAPAGEVPSSTSPAGPARSEEPLPQATTPVPPGLTWRQRLSRIDVRFSPYLYISPFFLLFLVIGMFPLIYTGYVSVHEWSLIGGKGEFVGLDNYRAVFEDRYFWRALRNTVSIFLLSSVPQVILALIIAGLLDTQLRARTFWRMSILVPFVVAPAAVTLIFGNLFGDRYGLINSAIGVIGIDPVAWHVDTLASHIAIASMVNWRWTGYNALILLAAMQAVPRDLYESAALDGAGKVRQFRSITIPMIRPTVIFVIITSTIGGLQIFTEARLFDNVGLGGSDRQWQTVTLYLWELGWRLRNLGMASAVAWLLFLFIVMFALVNLLLSRRIGGGGKS